MFIQSGDLPGTLHGDTNCHAPYRAFIERALKQGHFPDRCAGAYLGYPILSQGQIAPLYPSTILDCLLPLPAQRFFLGDLWTHAILASLGCAWLVRRRGHSELMALVLGWAYSNSSAFLFRATAHWTLMHQAALLPWLLAAWEELDHLRPGRIARPVAVFAALTGLMLLAQNPQWLYTLAFILAPLEAWRCLRRRKRLPIPARVGALAAAAILAAILGAAAWLPSFLGLGDTFRSILKGAEWARHYSLSKVNLLALVSPYFLLGNTISQFLGAWSPMESVVILGRGVVVLAAGSWLALAVQPQRWLGRAALPLGLVGGGLFFALAPEMFYFDWLVRWLPLFDSFRAWGRGGIFIALGLILGAAEGLRAFFSVRRRMPRALWITFACAAMLALAAAGAGLCMAKNPIASLNFALKAGISPTQFRGDINRAFMIAQHMKAILLRDALWYAGWAAAAGIMLWARRKMPWTRRKRWGRAVQMGVAALICAEGLILQRFTFRERAPLLTPGRLPHLSAWLLEQRAAHAPAPFTISITPRGLLNFPLYFDGVRNTHGSDVNMPANYALWLNQSQGHDSKTYQLEPDVKFYSQEFMAVTSLCARIELPGNHPAAEGWIKLDGLDVLPIRSPAPYAEFMAQGDAPSTPTASVVVRQWRETKVILKVRTQKPGTIRIREFPDRNWTIAVNGNRLPAQMEGQSLLVPVPAGKSTIHLSYMDAGARFSVALSLAGWMGLGAAALFVRRRRRIP